MTDNDTASLRVGWIGTGHMGSAMAGRVLGDGFDLGVWNRTRSKTDPLAERGARVVDSPAALADRDVVFTTVSASDDFISVTLGENGLLRNPDHVPRVIVDSSTISMDASSKVREEAAERGCTLLCAPVSGNGSVAAAGRLSVAVSGPVEALDLVRPAVESFATRVSHVGGGELARLVKVGHNLFLAAVIQSLAEITVLVEKGGVSRAAFLEFMNDSVMGSVFTRYKTPALVNLDFSPTFTPVLLRKDLEIGLASAAELEVPMPLIALTHSLVQAAVGMGYTKEDFAVLLKIQADNAGLDLRPEDVFVDDGLAVERDEVST